MTYDKELFRELDRTTISKVKIGNGGFITIKEKGTFAIESCSGTKIITDVLYVLQINQNLSNIVKLLEKGHKTPFDAKMCLLQYAKEQDIFKVKMKGESFSLGLTEEVQAAISSAVNKTELWHDRLGHFNHASLLYIKERIFCKTFHH
ncbi:hypothetical protein Fmac_003051 [Flemingia macrophylla]|uniref:Retrovirus-related Pol polyprotein from transposon TNT 1-94-like beta-barrel domain-containing protein n=1 Tax=Flemingia macrophylla TaxID=520843 RepID=A0ABD1NMD0_9FABA